MVNFHQNKSSKRWKFKEIHPQRMKNVKETPEKRVNCAKKTPLPIFRENNPNNRKKIYERIHPFKSSSLAIFTKIKPQEGENLKRFNLKERTMSTNHPKKGWIVPKKNPCKFSNKITPITKKNWKKPLQEYFFVHFHQNKIPTGWKF